MSTSKTFCFETKNNQEYCYDVNDEGLKYRAPDGETLIINWEDIDFLQDNPYRRIDIHIKNREDRIPVYYDTEYFELLLKTICEKLSAIHSRELPDREFKASSGYFLQIIAAISFSALVIVFGIEYSSILLLTVSALFLILAIHLMRRPLVISFSEDHFIIKSLFFKKSFRYSHVNELGFTLTGHEYSAYLVINIHMTDGKKIQLQRLRDITLCYIYLTARYRSS
jgi:hypothetical protein